MQSFRKGGWSLWIAGTLLAVALAPLCLGALGAFPAADDFVYATRTHATWAQMRSLPHVLVDAWRYARQIYANWQGTFVGAFVMALNPAVFTIAGYGWHAPALLLAFVTMQGLLLRAVGRWLRLPGGAIWLGFCGLTLLQWVWIPDLLEGLYWFNSAWFYTLPHGVWLLTLALAAALPDGDTLRRKVGFLLLWLCCAALGLENYITALVATCSLGLCAALLWRSQRRRALWLLPGFFLLVAGLLLSILAPGNAVRLLQETQYAKPAPWLFHAAWRTIEASATLAFRFLLRTPVLGVCALVAPGVFRLLRGREGAPACRHPLLVLLASWLLLCVMVFPHVYTAGYPGPARVVNLYYLYCTLAALCVTAYGMGALAQKYPRAAADRKVRWLSLGCGTVLLALALWSPPVAYPALIRDLADGTITAYRAQTLAQFQALAQAEPGSDPRIPPGDVAAPNLAYPPFPADPAHWANEAMSTYFRVHSVGVASPK